MKPLHQIIIEPHITEATAKGLMNPQGGIMRYTFKVAMSANKHEIREAIETRFGVKVDTVRTVVVRGKIKRVRLIAGKRPNWKKAYIKLLPGEKIKEFEGT
jgi:large subunit ribosomal protein L23